MRIGEVAARAGVGVQTVRFYERRGLLGEPRRSPSGYRDYPGEAVQTIRFIKGLQEHGFTLREIERLLRGLSGRTLKAADLRGCLESKLRTLDEKIESLRSARERLRGLSALLDGAQCPDLRSFYRTFLGTNYALP
jgi:MerR family transcriptional regulator, mercuric resistance operon regulatory protein